MVVLASVLMAGTAFSQEGEDAEGEEPEMVGSAPDSESDSGSDMPTAESETDSTDTGSESRSSAGGHPSTNSAVVVAPHVGVSFPAFSDLGTWGNFGLELGYTPAIDGRPLEIALMGWYSQPTASGTESDARLGEGGGEYNWNLTQQILTLDLVGIWRFRVSESLAPYGLAGPRMNMMRSTMTAEGNGAQFGESQETNNEFGLVFGGGVDYALGPGTFFGELKFGWTNLDQRITGNSNTGSFLLDIGYRLYF